jgi:hypothetical protein
MDRAFVDGNRGSALLERGDPAAALPALENAARSGSNEIGVRCALCRALGELGRIDEARIQLRLAEDCRKRTIFLTAGGRREVSAMLHRCRDQLAELKPGDLKALDEL